MSFTRAITVALLFAYCPATVTRSTISAQEKAGEKRDDKTELNKALKTAASLGQVEQVRDLIRQGADLQWRDAADNGKTPLVKAILLGKFEVVKVLLDSGADIHYPDGSGRYPIYFCCIGTNVELLKYLIAKGGHQDINSGPFSVLVSLCDHGQASAELIPLLVAAGADPDVFKGKVSPLIAAIQLNPKVRRPEIARSYVQALIAAQADVNLKDKQGMSPLHWAKQRGDQEIIAMLMQAGARE